MPEGEEGKEKQCLDDPYTSITQVFVWVWVKWWGNDYILPHRLPQLMSKLLFSSMPTEKNLIHLSLSYKQGEGKYSNPVSLNLLFILHLHWQLYQQEQRRRYVDRWISTLLFTKLLKLIYLFTFTYTLFTCQHLSFSTYIWIIMTFHFSLATKYDWKYIKNNTNCY